MVCNCNYMELSRQGPCCRSPERRSWGLISHETILATPLVAMFATRAVCRARIRRRARSERSLRSHLHCGNPGADDRRPPARRSYAAHAPARRDGPVNCRTFARTFFVRTAAARFSARVVSEEPRTKGDDRRDFAV